MGAPLGVVSDDSGVDEATNVERLCSELGHDHEDDCLIDSATVISVKEDDYEDCI